jgi:phosphoribosylanthranilate isomerase
MSVRIKICGITNQEDARLAVDAGADALGFVFCAGSPRLVAPPLVAEITRHLPGRVLRVGVFLDAAPTTILHTVSACGLDAVQLHGDESPEFCDALAPFPVWKAFRVRSRDMLQQLAAYRDVTAAWLLDGHVEGQAGGTGATFNWDLALEAKQLAHPIVLAGGLTPENVAEAVRQVRPAAVDVSSGVESVPGKKDADKVRRFIAAVRSVGRESASPDPSEQAGPERAS